VRVLLAVLEHLVLCFLLLLQVTLHGLLLPLLGFALRAILGVDRIIRLGSSRNGEAEAGNCQAKKDSQSFHKFPVNGNRWPNSTPERAWSGRLSVTEVTAILVG
jgi:hypothetical protein